LRIGNTIAVTKRYPVPRSEVLTAIRLSQTRHRVYFATVDFEWDRDKDELNQRNHGVSFAEASTVFLDPLHATVRDDCYAVDELRFRTIGQTVTGRLIIVAHTERADRIRIISARDGTNRERRQYEQ
jgi:uncharacterized DUF497 family protein